MYSAQLGYSHTIVMCEESIYVGVFGVCMRMYGCGVRRRAYYVCACVCARSCVRVCVSGFDVGPIRNSTVSEGQVVVVSGRSFSEQDIASSLLFSTTDQLAQTIYLVARNCRVRRAVFCGSFAGQNSAIMRQLCDKLAQCSALLRVRQCK